MGSGLCRYALQVVRDMKKLDDDADLVQPCAGCRFGVDRPAVSREHTTVRDTVVCWLGVRVLSVNGAYVVG